MAIYQLSRIHPIVYVKQDRLVVDYFRVVVSHSDDVILHNFWHLFLNEAVYAVVCMSDQEQAIPENIGINQRVLLVEPEPTIALALTKHFKHESIDVNVDLIDVLPNHASIIWFGQDTLRQSIIDTDRDELNNKSLYVSRKPIETTSADVVQIPSKNGHEVDDRLLCHKVYLMQDGYNSNICISL